MFGKYGGGLGSLFFFLNVSSGAGLQYKDELQGISAADMGPCICTIVTCFLGI